MGCLPGIESGSGVGSLNLSYGAVAFRSFLVLMPTLPAWSLFPCKLSISLPGTSTSLILFSLLPLCIDSLFHLLFHFSHPTSSHPAFCAQHPCIHTIAFSCTRIRCISGLDPPAAQHTTKRQYVSSCASFPRLRLLFLDPHSSSQPLIRRLPLAACISTWSHSIAPILLLPPHKAQHVGVIPSTLLSICSPGALGFSIAYHRSFDDSSFSLPPK